MNRTLDQQIDDWFRNSPDWPLQAIAVDDETAAFQTDGTDYTADEVRAAIVRFCAASGVPPTEAC